MRKDNIALLALFLLVVMASTLFPVKAFIYPDGSVDGLYEDFGPRLDKLQIVMYDGLDAMWTGLQNGEIDVADWPLTTSWLNTFTTSPYNETAQVTSYGGEAGFYTLDFNLNNNEYLGDPPNPTYPNPVSDGPNAVKQNPASDLHFRRGVNYLFNRTWYQGIIAGWGIMIYTPVPYYMGSPNPGEGVINQNIRPGGSLEALTYPNNEADAEAEFALAKMKIVAGQNGDKRFWDRDDNNICDAGEEIVVHINARQDTGRRKAVEWLDARLIAMGFVTNTHYHTGYEIYQETNLDKSYHLTTLGWIFIGPDPDYLYDVYHVTGYWHDPESSAPNTQCLNDTDTNYWAEAVKFNLTGEGARLSAWKFQEAFATVAAQIPLYSLDGYKAHSRTYVGGTPEEAAYAGSKWEGLCDEMGFGDNSWYSFENAHPQGFDFGAENMTIRYGWSETGYPQHLNPLYSGWYWDEEVVDKIYDTLGHRDPYALSGWKPYLIENWTVGTWMDGAVEKSKVKITLRPDIKWSDGVALTVDDVIYSLTQVAHDLHCWGFPPPWSWCTAQWVQSAYAIDPYNVEILFAVRSFLVESWTLGGFYIIPKHVWLPLIGDPHSIPPRPGKGDPTTFAPDPNMIGSGPWRYVSMNSGASLLMVANKPGSVVTTDRAGAVPITSPGAFNYYPVDLQAYETTYLAKCDFSYVGGWVPDPLPPTVDTLEFKVRLHNMWWEHPLTVNKTVTITVPGQTPMVNATNGLILVPGVPHVEIFTVNNALAGKIQINVTIVYQTAPFVGLTRTVIMNYWITMKNDIGGAFLTGSSPLYPVPDFNVDGKDNAIISKAFGTKPGDARWSPISDINGDYKVDGKDLARICKYYGWHA